MFNKYLSVWTCICFTIVNTISSVYVVSIPELIPTSNLQLKQRMFTVSSPKSLREILPVNFDCLSGIIYSERIWSHTYIDALISITTAF